MAQKTLSIVTISLNAEKHVARTLQSVAQQGVESLSQIEHWLVDGQSKDRTLEIAKGFPHVKISSEKDSGISDAFNRGIKLSEGRWVLFLNADDALADAQVLSDILPILIQAHEKSVETVYGRLEVIDAESLEVLHIAGRDNAWESLHQRMTLPHPATFMSREYFNKFGLFDTHFKIAMDYELLLRGLDKSRFQFTNRIITRFSAGGISVTKAGWAQAKECLQAKIKNGISSWPARLAWWGYQGLRWSTEKKIKNVPLVGNFMKRIAQKVSRGF